MSWSLTSCSLYRNRCTCAVRSRPRARAQDSPEVEDRPYAPARAKRCNRSRWYGESCPLLEGKCETRIGIESGEFKSFLRFRAACSSNDPKRILQDKDLNFRAIDSSSFNECMVEVLYERPASTRRFIPTVHPSSLLLSTLNRISSARQPLDADLDLLVAIYWLEEDSRTVLQADTFVDLKRIRHLDVFGFVEDNLQALTERMRSKLVVDYAKKVSIERFHRELGRDYLVNMIRDLFQGVSQSLVQHWPLSRTGTDEHYPRIRSTANESRTSGYASCSNGRSRFCSPM